VQVLDNPTVSPFGNPIPGLALLGLADAADGPDQAGLARLTELPVGDSVAVVVRQLTEHVQGDVALISRLKEAGVVPNARVLVHTGPDGDVTIMVGGHENVELPHEMAHAVKVEKV
jgi:DtxR family Mn-dependent transcriptional regulator